jgi:hypothetical protein
MNTSFANLKRSSTESLSKLTQELTKINNPSTAKSSDDDRFWKPEVDKAGNGSATIRFLPAPAGEDMPFIRIWDHGFQGPTGKWYIEKSLTTIGQNDPVAEYNSELWAVSDSDDSPTRKQARVQKRRLHFTSNILVVRDPANPANEGKVFLYQYGKKIFDKLNDLMNPAFDDEKPVNPFDLWEGANFKLRIRKVAGYRNYDQSEFETPAPISGTDEDLEAIWNKEYGLKEFVDPKNFKSYEELKTKLNAVLGLSPSSTASGSPASRADRVVLPEASAPNFKTKETEDLPWKAEDEDEDLSYFEKLKSLANED